MNLHSPNVGFAALQCAGTLRRNAYALQAWAKEKTSQSCRYKSEARELKKSALFNLVMAQNSHHPRLP